MASGHVNRIKRPNTWLHRPMLQNVKKALANSEPSTHGTKRTWPDVRLESAFGVRADVICSERVFPVLTHTGSRPRGMVRLGMSDSGHPRSARYQTVIEPADRTPRGRRTDSRRR